MTPPETELLSRVEQTVRQRHLFRSGNTLIVALSGGADSTALLDLLSRLPGFSLRLVAAHLNHCLRGVESDADEEFCRCLASRYAIPFESRRVDVRTMSSELRLSLEDAGRRARIQFLDEISATFGAAAVVLAHHGDDQAETVLMRLLRGSGMTGLSGMAYRNGRGYIRPLLDISRSEIEQYLRSYSLEWREDASNVDISYLRNRIRHQLLPLLEGYNPAIRTCLASTASIISDDEALLEQLTLQAFDESCRMDNERIVCDVGLLRTYIIALRRRVLRYAFKQLTGTLVGMSKRHSDSLCNMIDSERPNSQLALPHAVAAVREYDSLMLMPTVAVGTEAGYELLITAPGFYQLPSGGTLTVTSADSVDFPTDPGTACFDLAMLPFPWLVRTFRPGDRMTPFGMSGRKKIKDIFIDRKVPLSGRSRVPLLFCGTDLIWLAGICFSELNRLRDYVHSPVKVTYIRH